MYVLMKKTVIPKTCHIVRKFLAYYWRGSAWSVKTPAHLPNELHCLHSNNNNNNNNNNNKPCGGDEDANGVVRYTDFFVMVPYLSTVCTVYWLTSEKRWWSLFAVYHRVINCYSVFACNYIYWNSLCSFPLCFKFVVTLIGYCLCRSVVFL
jgi:hypothetical protein